MPTHPPKTGFDAFSAAEGAIAAAGRLTGEAAQQITGPWKGLAWALGQSGPAYVNRANTAIRALKKYGG